jgi:hypothetical protein
MTEADDLVCTSLVTMDVKLDCDEADTCCSWLLKMLPEEVTVCRCCWALIAFCKTNQIDQYTCHSLETRYFGTMGGSFFRLLIFWLRARVCLLYTVSESIYAAKVACIFLTPQGCGHFFSRNETIDLCAEKGCGRPLFGTPPVFAALIYAHLALARQRRSSGNKVDFRR